jgi:hypothetical protein
MVAKLARITTHNTTKHTTTNMSGCRCHPTVQQHSPLSLLVWQRCPQILVPCLSYECARGASRRVCARHFSSPCLGRPNAPHQIIERGGVPWPLVATVLMIHTTIKRKMAFTSQWMLGRTRCRGGACGGMLSLCSGRRIQQQQNVEN